MFVLRTTAIAATIIALLAPSLATAAPLRAKRKVPPRASSLRTHGLAARHRTAGRHAPRYAFGARPIYGAPYGAAYAYGVEGWESMALHRQALINQYAPGVTNELAPENKATASGGPSGGVPGFSGH